MNCDEEERQAETIFEEQWAIYRKVVDHDYMGHCAIGEAVKSTFADRYVGDLLDLGCGDAEISSQIAGGKQCRSFTGVDLSSAALGFAKDRITAETNGSIEANYVRKDLLNFVGSSPSAGFDSVLAGFSVHHLSQDDKREFFSSVQKLLKPGGLFFFYDVFLLDGMNREQSVGKYLDWIAADWTNMTAREHELIREHIWASDFPESPDWVQDTARLAGFTDGIQNVTCCHGYHLGYSFSC